MNFTILRFDSVGSTNTEAAVQASQGAAEGLCVMAEQQTAGRGRQARTWISEKGSGLYFSVVLRPKFDTRYFPLITLMAGVAVHDALEEFGIRPDIKWVNDILVNDRKIAGILAETVDSPDGLAVVVGIGINLTSRNFPAEIAETATSIGSETGKTCTADDLAESLTPFLSYFYEILSGPNGPADIIDAWRRRSTYFSGKNIRVTLAGDPIEGVTDGLEENGALRVKISDGSVRIVQAGDVERVRPNG